MNGFLIRFLDENMPEDKPLEEKPTVPQVNLLEEVLGNILDVHMRLNEFSHTKASLLIAAAGVILTLIITDLPNIKEMNIIAKAGIGIIALTSEISLLINILVVDPKIGETKRKNLFYFKSFLRHYSIDDYSKEISKLLKNEDYIIDQYAREIYDLSNRIIEPKFKLLKLATIILIGGVVVGSAMVFASILI